MWAEGIWWPQGGRWYLAAPGWQNLFSGPTVEESIWGPQGGRLYLVAPGMQNLSSGPGLQRVFSGPRVAEGIYWPQVGKGPGYSQKDKDKKQNIKHDQCLLGNILCRHNVVFIKDRAEPRTEYK